MTTQISHESAGVTFRGSPMTLVGTPLHKGDTAPPFTLVTTEMKPFTLDDALGGGTSALLIVVPSLDTQTCSLETQTFHKRLDELPKNVRAFIISADLPFAQQRWAAANEALALTYLSDYRERSFGTAYGVVIKELALLARAIFLIRPDKSLAYVEIVKEVADEPNYEAVFAAAKG
jgi:thiol peroxidase